MKAVTVLQLYWPSSHSN